jgi:hypothetical protein
VQRLLSAVAAEVAQVAEVAEVAEVAVQVVAVQATQAAALAITTATTKKVCLGIPLRTFGPYELALALERTSGDREICIGLPTIRTRGACLFDVGRTGFIASDRQLGNEKATGADYLVTANPGCQLQLAWGVRQAGLSQEVLHIMELLGRAVPD